jgi:hypothetical protein
LSFWPGFSEISELLYFVISRFLTFSEISEQIFLVLPFGP